MTPYPVIRWAVGRKPGKRSVSSRSRSRRAVLTGLLGFAAGCLLLNLIIETSRPKWREPDYAWRIERARALQHANRDKPFAVMLGSSRTQMGFRPADMHRDDFTAFNIAAPGAGPYHHRLALERLIDAGVVPEMLLIELLPITLGQANGAVEEFQHTLGTLSARDIARLGCYRPSAELTGQWTKARAVPWQSQRGMLLSHLAPRWAIGDERMDWRWQRSDEYGWIPYFHHEITPDHRARNRVQAETQYRGPLAVLTVAPEAERIYRDLVDRAKSLGMTVAIVLMPEGPVFRSWTPPATRDLITATVSRWRDDWGLTVIDARDWLPDEHWFADSHHLMRHGATEFSRRLGRELPAHKKSEPRSGL